MSKSRIITLAAAAALLAAPAPLSFAQEGRLSPLAPQRSLTTAREKPGLTAAQQAQLADLAKMVDSRVLAGFRGREDLKARMENDLRDLSKISDRPAKAQAIKAFQSRYSADYRQVLAAGGVDLRAVAERLRAIFPDAVFVVENGTHVVEATSPPPAAPPPPPAATKQTVTGSQMTQDPRSGDCGGGGSGRIDTSRPSGQTNSARVSNIGNCGGIGFMNYSFDTPQGMKSTMAGLANVNTEASVVAVTGASYASGKARVMRTGLSEGHVLGLGNYPSASSSVFVAIAWAASHSDPRPRQQIREIENRGTFGLADVAYLRAKTVTSAWSFSAHGDADAWASVQDINVVITTRALSPDDDVVNTRGTLSEGDAR